MNRLSDDLCTYRKALDQSVSELEFLLDPRKFEHCRRARMQSGIVGGTAVSHILGADLVDVESELFGVSRVATRCPALLYDPRRHGPSNRMEHLPPAQIHHVSKVPIAVWVPPQRCGGDSV